jgi:hypothetical protein
MGVDPLIIPDQQKCWRGEENLPAMGFEPATYGLQNRCSTVELHRRVKGLMLLIFLSKDLTFKSVPVGFP